MKIRFVSAAAALLLAAACADAPAPAAARPPAAEPAAAPVAAPSGPVDSILPNAESQRRFREGLPEVASLAGASESRDALVRRFARAVERHDTADLRAMVMSRAEFAYLYYPHTRYTRRPYELPPELLWFTIEQNSEKGIVRVLRRLGGQPLGVRSVECEDEPEAVGPAGLWNRCLVRRAGDGPAERLFGSIMELDGRYKFVSYANEF
ncbi:MAG TPA: hypothetical protein VF615_24810 [Longimicrobiaceae bacterium]|jgi:hypothetical protein